MCALVGFLDEKKNCSFLEKMCNKLEHGKLWKVDKYAKGCFSAGRVHLGFANPHPQPLMNDDGSLIIFMDGSVFGYAQEMKNLKEGGHVFKVGDDAEFCLHLFEEYGEKFVEKLNGGFVILIFNIDKRELYIFNDMGGFKPLFYFSKDDRLIFSSEIKSILEDESIVRELNDDAVADFFTFGKLLGDKTFFKGIKNLPPGSVLTFNEKGLSVRKYWEFNFNRIEREEEYFEEKLVEILERAVNLRYDKFKKEKMGVTLSGGLDTRIITHLIKDKKHLNIFAYGHGKNDDIRVAKSVSKLLKKDLMVFDLNVDLLPDAISKGVYLTEGLTSAENFLFMTVVDDVKKHFDFILVGSGMGEFFGDNMMDESALSLINDEEAARYINNRLNPVIREKYKPLFFSREYYRKIKGKTLESIKKELGKLGNKTKMFDKVYAFLMKNHTREIMLPKNFLDTHFEVLSPAFDREFVDFIIQTPPRMRIKRFLEFGMINRISSKLSTIPYNRTGIPIKFHKFSHKKRGKLALFEPDDIGFIDYAKSLRENNKLREFFLKILLDEKTLGRGYFNASVIKKLVHNHMDERGDYHKILFALVTFELLLRFFFDN